MGSDGIRIEETRLDFDVSKNRLGNCMKARSLSSGSRCVKGVKLLQHLLTSKELHCKMGEGLMQSWKMVEWRIEKQDVESRKSICKLARGIETSRPVVESMQQREAILRWWEMVGNVCGGEK
jgi:hypothetical protein